MMAESDSPVRTPGYDRFREVAGTVGEDSWELFAAIQNLNPYAADMRKELLDHLDELQRRLAEEHSRESAEDRRDPDGKGKSRAGARDSG
jgi:hypothetical protein